MENIHHSKRRRAMEQELLRGRDIANQLLGVVVHKSRNNHHGVDEGLILPFAEDLVHQVLRSFTNTLLLLNTNSDFSDEVVVPINIGDFSSSPSCQKHEDMDEACTSFDTKNRIRRHKRKSIVPTWEKDSLILIEDGHAWRKYGQKKTMKSKYLRNYYRCTHKYDQGCPAIKQVQRIQEDPPLYRTTYYGHHNCKSTFNQEIILEPDSFSGSSMFLSFNNSIPSQEHPFSSPVFESTKKEEPVEVIHDDHIAHNQLYSSDYLLLCDNELDFDYSRHVAMLSSADTVQFDNFYGCGLNFGGLACFGQQNHD